MIRILDKPKKREFVVVCKKCSCKFTFEQTNLCHHPNGNEFVWCPYCLHKVAIVQLIEYKRPEPKPITTTRKIHFF